MYSGQLCKLYTFESVGSFHLHKGTKIPQTWFYFAFQGYNFIPVYFCMTAMNYLSNKMFIFWPYLINIGECLS